jgi:hypothetical protein
MINQDMIGQSTATVMPQAGSCLLSRLPRFHESSHTNLVVARSSFSSLLISMLILLIMTIVKESYTRTYGQIVDVLDPEISLIFRSSTWEANVYKKSTGCINRKWHIMLS